MGVDCLSGNEYNYLVFHKKSLKTPKEVIMMRKSKKDTHKNDQKKMNKRTNNNLQSTTQKTKDRATLTPLKTGLNSRREAVLAPLIAPVVLL